MVTNLAGNFLSLYGQEQATKANSTTSTSIATLSVSTDRIKYVPGQSIRISGTVYNEKGDLVDIPVSVKVKKYFPNASILQTGKTVYQAILIPNKGNYSAIIYNGLMEGQYNVTSFISDKSAKAFNFISGTSASTDINVENFLYSRASKVLLVGLLIGIIGLFIVIKRVEKRKELRTSDEILQFIFMSILAFTPILAFALTDVAVFPNAPIGIIIKPSTVVSSQNATESRGEWMLNIGGTSSDKYKSGIQIPLAVLIFGIGGGYMRYLVSEVEPVLRKRKNLTKGKQVKKQSESTQEQSGRKNEHDAIFEILYNVILLFLSPLLAMAIWLFLWQGGTTSPFTLAAVSFVTGLVTKEAVNALTNFASRIFQGKEEGTGEKKPNGDTSGDSLEKTAANKQPGMPSGNAPQIGPKRPSQGAMSYLR